MAHYLIEYFRDTKKIGSTPWADTLDKTKRVATDGLIRHNADFVRIIDVDGSGAEIWSDTRDI